MTDSATHSIKIRFEGDARDMELPAAATLADLEAAIASTFGVDLPGRPRALSFTYKDGDGDDIVLDKDSELLLALRLCPAGTLEISAARKDSENVIVRRVDPEGRLLKIATRNLREYNGQASMTPAKLAKTLALLKLSPRHLVKQGLAPRVLLARIKVVQQEGAKQRHPPGGGDSDDLAESVASGMEVMALEEDDKKEWNDGFAAAEQPAAACDDATSSSSSDNENDVVNDSSTDDNDGEHAGDAPVAVKKNLLHKAFVDGGVQLRPREVRPLLLALGVKPCRLARLGLVDAKDLRAMLHAERKKTNKGNGGFCRRGPQHPHHPRHHRMVRGGPGGPPRVPCVPFNGFPRGPPGFMMRRGGGGDSGGRHGPGAPAAGGKMMPLHHAHPPPPPPHHMEEEDDGMFDAPAEAGVPGAGARRGGHGPPHPHGHPHPHHPPYADGTEEGEGGPGFHHGPPPGMRMRMHRVRHGGGDGGQQVQDGYRYWG